jgi:hypothetical protein
VVAPDHTRLIALENTSLAVGPSLASGLFVTLIVERTDPPLAANHG